MTLNRAVILMMLASVAMVTSLSVLPGTNPKLPPLEDLHKLLRTPKIPPGPITVPPPYPGRPFLPPPRYCTCEVRCCTHLRQKRRAISSQAPALAALLNTPLLRHKRCCGCHPCHWLRRMK